MLWKSLRRLWAQKRLKASNLWKCPAYLSNRHRISVSTQLFNSLHSTNHQIKVFSMDFKLSLGDGETLSSYLVKSCCFTDEKRSIMGFSLHIKCWNVALCAVSSRELNICFYCYILLAIIQQVHLLIPDGPWGEKRAKHDCVSEA